MYIAMIDDRIRPVHAIIERTSDKVTASVTVGYRRRSATCGSNPGSGYRPVPGEPRRWYKMEPIVDSVTLDTDMVRQMSSWPSIDAEHVKEAPGFIVDEYNSIIDPMITAGVDASGARGRRVPPSINIGTIELEIKEAGLPMFESQEDLDAYCTERWETLYPRKRPVTSTADELLGSVPEPSVEDLVGDMEAEATGTSDADAELTDADVDDDGGDDDMVIEPEPEDAGDDDGLIDDDETAEARAKASDRGWPDDYIADATLDEKGSNGYTLKYMRTFNFDPEKHG